MGRADSPLRDRVIFVEGAPRSGTTLLASFIASHPDVAGTVAESHIFDRGIGNLVGNHRESGEYLANYIDGEQLLDLSRELCDGVLAAMRARVKPDAAYVMEKTPAPAKGAAQVLARKFDVYPDAHYVHIVREEAAVVRSLMRAPWNAHDEVGSLEWRRRGVAAIRDAMSASDRYLEIDYDDLAARPRETMAGVYEGLGLDAGDEPLARVEALSSERISSFGPDVSPASGRSRSASLAAAGRRVASRLRGAGAAEPRDAEPADPGLAAAQALIVAARKGDCAAIGELTTDDFELTLRSGGGDAVASGAEARQLLLDLVGTIFARQFVTESWAPISGAADHGSPITGLMLGATLGDGSRIDMVFASLLDDGGVQRLAITSAGDPAGRAPSRWAVAS